MWFLTLVIVGAVLAVVLVLAVLDWILLAALIGGALLIFHLAPEFGLFLLGIGVVGYVIRAVTRDRAKAAARAARAAREDDSADGRPPFGTPRYYLWANRTGEFRDT